MTTIAYKMFNDDWTCRGYQYEVGQTYKLEGEPDLCGHGFHACLNPIECFGFYPPTGKCAVVEYPGEVVGGESSDTKICGVEIHIKAEISLPEFIGKGVEYILSKVNFDGAKETNTGYQSAATNTGNQSAATNTGYQSAATNTGYQSAATNTGYQSAATNTGNQSAATNTGYQSAATNTGNRSAATNTGNQSAATNTGNQSAATVEGKNSIAVASGCQGKAAASEGSAICLVERNDEFEIIAVWAGIAGRDGIKADTFYTLTDGKPVEVV